MKYALVGLSPIQVGSLRMIITTLVLLPFGFKSILNLTAKNWIHIAVSAVLGTLIPVFLFAIAINNMDSAIAAILNSFVPFNALIIGALVFGFTFQKNQIFGIIIGLIGTVLLIINGHSIENIADYKYPSMILLASVGYAFNANIVKRYLQDVKPLAITTGTFAIVLIPAVIILLKTDFFETIDYNVTTKMSLFYIAILSVVGTAIAKVFFNKLLHTIENRFTYKDCTILPLLTHFP